MRNVDAWGKVHERYPQFTGHIGTIWGRNQCQSPINSLLPPSMFMAAYLTETLTAGVIQDRRARESIQTSEFLGYRKDIIRHLELESQANLV